MSRADPPFFFEDEKELRVFGMLLTRGPIDAVGMPWNRHSYCVYYE